MTTTIRVGVLAHLVALTLMTTAAEAQERHHVARCSGGPGDCVWVSDGKDGADGADGRDGRDGVDAPTGPRTIRPFDLGVHGVNFGVRAAVPDGTQVFLLVYEPTLRAAALVDTATGLAQVALGFDAGVGPDEQGRVLTFDDVTVMAPRSFAWWHRGAAWVATWDETLPWQALPVVNGVPLFRWR